MTADVKAGIINAVSGPMKGRHFKLFLFGSRARGASSVRSDYDLALSADSLLDLATMGNIRARLDDLDVMQNIDLVDLKSVSAGFSEAVSREAVVLDEH